MNEPRKLLPNWQIGIAIHGAHKGFDSMNAIKEPR